MTVKYITGDICHFTGDAIVNAANVTLLGGGGVDGAIHKAAGPELREWCFRFPERWPFHQHKRILTGEALVTPGFRLQAKYVIHTVGPIFPKGRDPAFPGERKMLDDASAIVALGKTLENCFDKAEKFGVKQIAFPAISCGVFGCDIGTFAEQLHATLGQDPRYDDLEVTVYLFDGVQYDMFDMAWKRLNG